MARGSVFHASVEDWAKTGRLVLPEDAEIAGWLELLAYQWKPQKGMQFEIAAGLNVDGGYTPVQELKPHVYTPAQDSVPNEYLLTAGRADVAWVTADRTAWVLDWKTGNYAPERPTTNLQFWALGLAICQWFKADSVAVGMYMARDGAFDWSEPVKVGSEGWAERLADVRAAATVGEEPKPGVNCIKCWEKKGCEFYEQA